MSKAELEHWIDKLSRAPEGVYDPWSEENWVPANGSAPSPDPKDTAR